MRHTFSVLAVATMLGLTSIAAAADKPAAPAIAKPASPPKVATIEKMKALGTELGRAWELTKDLFSGNEADVLSKNRTALLSGNAPKVLSENQTPIFSGNSFSLLSNIRVEIHIENSGNSAPPHSGPTTTAPPSGTYLTPTPAPTIGPPTFGPSSSTR